LSVTILIKHPFKIFRLISQVNAELAEMRSILTGIERWEGQARPELEIGVINCRKY
jgi:hypothetical protein